MIRPVEADLFGPLLPPILSGRASHSLLFDSSFLSPVVLRTPFFLIYSASRWVVIYSPAGWACDSGDEINRSPVATLPPTLSLVVDSFHRFFVPQNLFHDSLLLVLVGLILRPTRISPVLQIIRSS